jgi:hypothetical protein
MAAALISTESRWREAASSFLESSAPGRREPGAKITAAAATGPASELIPASSTPATCCTPGRSECTLVPEQLAEPLALGPVVKSAPHHGRQYRPGTRTRVGVE